VAPQSHGLDFGCGPGPTLSIMLEELGHTMKLYDIYYHPERSVLEQQYDFVTATEVIEHLYEPAQVWQQWLNLVKPGGWLGIMTKMVIDVEAFAHWHYKNDLTHVIFFSQATFEYLAERDKLELEFRKRDKKRKGLKTGTRNSEAKQNKDQKAAQQRDPRLGSKKKIPLIVAEVKKPTKAERRVSAAQELEMLENDAQLLVLLDRIEDGENLGSGLQKYVDEKLNRIEVLMKQLGLYEEDIADDVEEIVRFRSI